MSDSKHKNLEDLIDQFFRSYALKRLILALLLSGVLCFGVAILIYALTLSPLWCGLAFALIGFLSLNLAVIYILPTAKQLKDSKALLFGAVRDRSRIHAYQAGRVTLLDAAGKAHTLHGPERRAWEMHILPMLFKNETVADAPEAKPKREYTASERRYIEDQRKAIKEREQALKDEQKRIVQEKDRLSEEREELLHREEKMQEAEEIVIKRLSEIEVVQAELDQMRESLDHKAKSQDGSMPQHLSREWQDREAAFKTKEEQLHQLMQQLEVDQKIVMQQKTDFSLLHGQLPEPEDKDRAAGKSSESDASALEDRSSLLEAERKRLEERSRYIEEIENSLIERLNELTEREAAIEQSEINSGLRED